MKRDSLAVPAFVLLAAWCAAAFLGGFVHFLQELREVWVDNHVGEDVPFAPGFSVLGAGLFFLSFMLINVALAGVVMGVISVARSGGRTALRVIAFLVVAVGGVIADIALSGWHTDDDDFLSSGGFLHDGRFQALLETLLPLVLLGGLALLLLPRRVATGDRVPA